MKFRKKPVEIEAIQWTGKNAAEILVFMSAPQLEDDFLTSEIKIETLEGTMTASKNDWIIRGFKGEIYPVKPDIFDMTYEKIGETE